MSRMIDRPAEPDGDGALRVATGGNRAELVFVSRAMLAARHPGVPLDALPAEGAVTVVVRVEDDDAAAAAVAGRAITREPGLVKVHPADANGIILVLTTG
jgi:hypothetical protein